jgi:uncharacterized membrane protein YdjX (TVP38/TMEM64 family)
MFLELLVLLAIMIVQVLVPPIPAELIVIGAGKRYGVAVTTLIAGTGLLLGSILVYWLGEWIEQRFGRLFDRERLQTIMERLRRIEVPLLLVRALPYNPSDLISYAAGIMGLKKKRFFLLTCFTSYSRCFVLAHFGAAISGMHSLIVVASILVVSALVAGALVYGRYRAEK